MAKLVRVDFRSTRHERSDEVSRYFQDIRGIPMLSREDEHRLFSRLDALRGEFSLLLATLAQTCQAALFDGEVPSGAALSSGYIDAVCTKLHLYAAEHSDQRLTVIVEQAYRHRTEMQYLRNKAVESNLRFVANIASKYTNMGLSYIDLIQAGNVGLMEAVDPYDQNHGTRFLTYAIWHIRKSILRALANEARTIRLPTYVLTKFKRVKEAQARFLKEHGRLPSISELAKSMHARLDAIEDVFTVVLDTVSFDAPLGDDRDAEAYSTTIPAPSPTSEERQSDLQELQRLLNRLLTHLTPRQVSVLRLRFGLNGAPQLRLQEIGNKLQVSREAIRQMERKALIRARKLVKKEEFAILARYLGTDDA